MTRYETQQFTLLTSFGMQFQNTVNSALSPDQLHRLLYCISDFQDHQLSFSVFCSSWFVQ